MVGLDAYLQEGGGVRSKCMHEAAGVCMRLQASEVLLLMHSTIENMPICIAMHHAVWDKSASSHAIVQAPNTPEVVDDTLECVRILIDR
jgi:hypothetical protein